MILIEKLLNSTEYKNFKISDENNISLDIFLDNNYQNIIIPNNYFKCICNSINKQFIFENNLKYDQYKNKFYTIPITINEINQYNLQFTKNNEIIIDKNILNIEILKEGIFDFLNKNNPQLNYENDNLYKKWEKGLELNDLVNNASEFTNLITNGITSIDPTSMALRISGLDISINQLIKNIPLMPKYYIPKLIQWAIKNRRNNNNLKSTVANKILNYAISIKKRDKMNIAA